jgi:hypothetical protein
MESLEKKIKKLEKQLKWFSDFADCVQGNHRAYETACEYADEEEAEREMSN